jgi:DNA polymerase-1
MKRLAVIDGKSVFYRGYYAMPGLSTKDGTPTGGVFGFVTLAIELIKKLEPDYVAVAWDKKGTNIRKRREIYPEYKAGRKKAPDDFYEQIPILQELLEAFGWPMYEIDDYEADDIMATFAREAEGKGIETCLITSDLDALQVVSPLTKVFAMKNGLGNIQEFTPESFEEKYGLKTEQFLDLKSLMGDSSDNLPGVPGVGQKTAVKLLQQYGDLDTIYAHLDDIPGAAGRKLREGKESAYLTKDVARLYFDVPIKLDWDVADVDDCDFAAVAEILRRLEFRSLIKRLPGNMQAENSEKRANSSGASKSPEQSAARVSSEARREAVLDDFAGDDAVRGQDEAVSDDSRIVISVPTVQKLPPDLVLEAETYQYIDILEPDTLYIACTPDVVYRVKIAEAPEMIWRAMEHGTVIAENVKALYHALDGTGVSVRFSEVWDVGQAAFLLDPLARDRSLIALSGDMNEGAEPALQMARLMRVYAQQKELMAQDVDLQRIAKEFDFPVIWSLFQIERRGMKLDTAMLAQMGEELRAELRAIEQEMYTLVGYEFNAASPVQLSEVLFTKLQLPTAGIKRGKTKYSTGQKELDKLRGQHPIIELIERHRELSKLMSTYIEALPKLVDKQSRLHTTFNQDVASTGRLSSTNPNLQNIPVRTELGRKIRQAFVPSEGKLFVSADYSQFELRLAAVLAGDESLIEDFNSDIDIHTKTAAEVYGVAMEEVTKLQRRAAKVINFGVLYGMSPHGLAAAAHMSFSEAKQFIQHYFAVRAPIRAYLDSTLEQAREQGYVATYFGRKRPTPDVKASNFIVRQAAERAAMNMPIQGTEADLMKLAMIRMEERLQGLGEQVLQVHDSILVECDPERVDDVSALLKREMEAIAPELPIRLKVDVSVGKNWGEV